MQKSLLSNTSPAQRLGCLHRRSASRRQDEEDEEGEEELTSHSLDDHPRITHPANGIG